LCRLGKAMKTDSGSNGGLKSKERARRFSIEMPLRYRVNAEAAWRKGTTENISCCGVLFRGDFLLEPGTPIEMSMVLPVGVFGNGAAEVICNGVVVRATSAAGFEGMPALATTISHYRLVRPRVGVRDERGNFASVIR
jgi:hypothetical protein